VCEFAEMVRQGPILNLRPERGRLLRRRVLVARLLRGRVDRVPVLVEAQAEDLVGLGLPPRPPG
jgi:hypothetical protein